MVNTTNSKPIMFIDKKHTDPGLPNMGDGKCHQHRHDVKLNGAIFVVCILNHIRRIILPHLKIIFATNFQSEVMANNEGVIQALHGEFMRGVSRFKRVLSVRFYDGLAFFSFQSSRT